MNDPIIARFAQACGAAAALDLRVDLVEGGNRVVGSVPMPFCLVGRDDACDVTLTDPDVNPRHAWLQVVGGRIFAIDLGSRTGLGWPGGRTGSGWLDVDVPVQIGPFLLRVCSPVSSRPVPFPPAYSPLQSDPGIPRSRVTTTLEFRNGKRAKDRWTVNRLVTLVGRAPECKIRLSADDIAGYHCGLVLTPAGLWVVDLSGRGVVVNGERMRVSHLSDGAELWVGRFLIGLHSSRTSTGTAAPQSTTQTPGTIADAGSSTRSTPSSESTPEDEVQVGIAPSQETTAGLPSSHIMADAFRLWTTTPGGISNPILVSGSGPPPNRVPVEPGTGPTLPSLLEFLGSTRPPGAAVEPASPPPLDPARAANVVSLLRELGELHGQILSQFHQSLGLMVRLFSCLGREQLPAMQRELARIQELNNELAQLQAELAARAATQPTTQTPLPRIATTTTTPTPMPDSNALHSWVADRIATLQRERQARWQSLVSMFATKSG